MQLLKIKIIYESLPLTELLKSSYIHLSFKTKIYIYLSRKQAIPERKVVG